MGGVAIQKFDSLGNVVWGDNSVKVTSTSTTSHFTSTDDQGGAIVAWGYDGGSYLQRIGPDGSFLWGNKEVRLDVRPR